MPNTKFQVRLRYVVRHLRSYFQRLNNSSPRARCHEWKSRERRTQGLCTPRGLLQAKDRPSVEMTYLRGRRSNGAATAFFCVAIFCAMSLLPALMAEEIPRIGVGVPPVPTGHIPARHSPAEPRPITQSAGFAFVGTVKAVEHVAAAGGNRIATTRITFHVDTAIQGVKAGQTLVITEWAGLWSSGERYRPGERVCLF